MFVASTAFHLAYRSTLFVVGRVDLILNCFPSRYSLRQFCQTANPRRCRSLASRYSISSASARVIGFRCSKRSVLNFKPLQGRPAAHSYIETCHTFDIPRIGVNKFSSFEHFFAKLNHIDICGFSFTTPLSCLSHAPDSFS